MTVEYPHAASPTIDTGHVAGRVRRRQHVIDVAKFVPCRSVCLKVRRVVAIDRFHDERPPRNVGAVLLLCVDNGSLAKRACIVWYTPALNLGDRMEWEPMRMPGASLRIISLIENGGFFTSLERRFVLCFSSASNEIVPYRLSDSAMMPSR